MRRESLLGCTRALGKANESIIRVKGLQKQAECEPVEVREVVEPLIDAVSNLCDAVMILLNEENNPPFSPLV